MTPSIALVIRSNREGVARLPYALRSAGLRVILFAKPDTFPSATVHRDAYFTTSPPANALMRFPSVLRFLWQLEGAAPPIAIAGDEAAILFLGRVDELVRHAKLGGVFPCASAAIRAGLPGRASFRHLLRRSYVAEIAARCGIDSPAWCGCHDPEAVQAHCRVHGFPVIVKRDSTSAGMGVHLCGSAEALASVLADLEGGGILQAFISGRTAMQAAVALEGRVLASCGWLKERCFPEPFGPSAVVRRIDDPAMAEAARRFAEETLFSGFFSLDFIVCDGAPRLIEINPRPTPVCHLGGLANALAVALGAEPVDPGSTPSRLAVFPQELRRNPDSANDPELVHDIPVHDPPLLKALSDAYFDCRIPKVLRTLVDGAI